MIQEIRSYFSSVINEVDQDLRSHYRFFTGEDIGAFAKEDTYFMQIGELITNRNDSDMTGSIQVNLYFWKNGYSDEIGNIDKAYCNAIEMQAKLMDQKRIDQLDFIKGVDGNSIIPTPAASNSNLAQFNLQFTVRVGYRAH